MTRALFRPLMQTASLLALGLALVCSPAQAHKGSDAYLEVQQTGTDSAGALRDFRLVLAVANNAP